MSKPNYTNCGVTVKVSGHVIDRLTEKIVKNVIKDEIDHNGAYLCDYEYSDHLFHQSNQCFNALKCPKIVKKFENYGAPPPPCLAADDLAKLIFLHQNSKSRRNHEQKHVEIGHFKVVRSIDQHVQIGSFDPNSSFS